jgi:hypothetical protein
MLTPHLLLDPISLVLHVTGKNFVGIFVPRHS